MKCVCGYHGNDFYQLNLTSVELVGFNNGGDPIYDDPEPITIYVCQKCGTLKIAEEE